MFLAQKVKINFEQGSAAGALTNLVSGLRVTDEGATQISETQRITGININEENEVKNITLDGKEFVLCQPAVPKLEDETVTPDLSSPYLARTRHLGKQIMENSSAPTLSVRENEEFGWSAQKYPGSEKSDDATASRKERLPRGCNESERGRNIEEEFQKLRLEALLAKQEAENERQKRLAAEQTCLKAKQEADDERRKRLAAVQEAENEKLKCLQEADDERQKLLTAVQEAKQEADAERQKRLKMAELERLERLKATQERQKRLAAMREAKASRLALEKATKPLTKRQVLDSRLPAVTDTSSMQKSCSKAVNRRQPKEVLSMSIKDEVIAFRRSLDRRFLDEPAISPQKSARPGGYIVGDEKGLDAILMLAICPALNSLTEQLNVQTSDVKTSGMDLGQGLSVPDHLSTYENGDGKLFVLVPWESKRHNFNSNDDSMARKFNENEPPIVDGVQKTTGHQYDSKCEYAVLHNYQRFWIQRLDPEGRVHISESFSCEAVGHTSVVNALHWLLNIALQSKFNTKSPWKCPHLVKVSDPESAVTGNAGSDATKTAGSVAKVVPKGGVLKQHNAKPTGKPSKQSSSRYVDADGCEGLELPVSATGPGLAVAAEQTSFSFLIYGVLQKNQDRQTLRAQIRNTGVEVVIKCYAEERDRDREARCYSMAQELQGHCIPKMLGTCLMAETRQCRHALVLTLAPGGNYESLPTAALCEVREILTSLHCCGVAHCDVQPRNMSYSFETGRLFLYDFSQALKRGGPDAPGADLSAFEAACAQDVRDLEELIEDSKTERARAMRYTLVR